MYDFDDKLMKKFKDLKLDFNEKSLLEKFKKYKTLYNLENSLKSLNKCNLIFISLDVKTNKKNIGDYSKIKKYIKILDKNIKKKTPFIIQSQLQPGFCDNLKIRNREIYYQVETLIFGKAFQRAYSPDRIIVGCKNSQNKINRFYLNYLSKFNSPVYKMDYYSAELSKIAINIYLSSSVTVANTLARISERIGSNYKQIEIALRSDSRIGSKSYLSPGLGISGGNLERDLTSLNNVMKKIKLTLILLNQS